MRIFWTLTVLAAVAVAIQYYRFKKFISDPAFLNKSVSVPKSYFPFSGSYIVDTTGIYSKYN